MVDEESPDYETRNLYGSSWHICTLCPLGASRGTGEEGDGWGEGKKAREKEREWFLFCNVNKSSLVSVNKWFQGDDSWFSADVRIFRVALQFSFYRPVSALRSEGPERGNVKILMEHCLPTAVHPCTALVLLPPWAFSGFPR